MASTDVRFVVQFDDTGAIKKIQEFDKAIEDLGKTSKTTQNNAKSFGQEFIGKLIPAMTAASLAADAVKKGFRFVKDELIETIKAGIEAEKVDRALESAVSIVGQAAGGTAERIKAYASALQRQTIYDDEAIKSAQALIIQMRGTASQIDVATRGAIGLASVFGMDLQSAARAVAQGMEGNYVMLGRLIPTIRDARTEGEKQTAMMRALAGYYQRAEADAGTFGGRLQNLKNTYGELQESLAAFITKNQAVIATLQGIKEILDWMERHAAKAGGSLAEATIRLVPGVQGFLQIASLAKKENDAWANSFAGMTTRMLEMRKTALDPLPIRITHVTSAIVTQTKVVNTELVAVNGLAHALYRLGTTELPPPKGLPEAQAAWLGLKTEAASTADEWESAMLSMTAGLVSFGDANATILENIGKVFGNFIKSAISGIESLVLKEIIAARAAKAADQAQSQSAAIKWIMKTFPWPISLVVAAGSFALINALFAKLFKFEKGGYFNKPTYIPGALVGEAGPEFILPERKLEAAIDRALGGRRARADTLAGPVSYAFTIKGPLISTTAALTDEMVSRAARKMLDEVEKQASLRGRRIQ